MDTNINHYNDPHAVVLIFERLINAEKGFTCDFQLQYHENYYNNIGDLGSIIHYGKVMNDVAICAIIHVSGASAFEKIIRNDPALKSGLYQIKQVIPFANY